MIWLFPSMEKKKHVERAKLEKLNVGSPIW